MKTIVDVTFFASSFAGSSPTPNRARRPNEARSLSLLLPIIVLVVAVTAIPLELRRINSELLAAVFDLSRDRVGLTDILSNIAGFVPVGAVFASSGVMRALGGGAALSAFVEICQLFSEGRTPSIIDLVSNIVGAAVGFTLFVWRYPAWRSRPPEITIRPLFALSALFLALGILANDVSGVAFTPRTALKVLSLAWIPTNDRGNTSTGSLEAHWTFDETQGSIANDISSNELTGALVNEPVRVAGVRGNALSLNGENQYMAAGNPLALRLAGSMTLSAWVKMSRFPTDDAAIISNTTGLGYQLDTTVDQGERTIGFKLGSMSGRSMIRYGKTSLITDSWYHIAGVYDAQAQTIDVYLNGTLDNGCLVGAVTSRQLTSGHQVFIGRRSDLAGFEFPGTLDDVRIYSRPLDAIEIESIARPGAMPSPAATTSDRSAGSELMPRTEALPCRQTEEVDATAIGLFVALGFFVSVACAGFWPTAAYRLPSLAICAAVGFLVYLAGSHELLRDKQWLAPLMILAGGVTAVACIRPRVGAENEQD